MATVPQLQGELSGQLNQARDLSAEQALQLKLQAEAYKGLTEAQRAQLVDLARQVDREAQIKKETELIQQQAEEATRAFEQFQGRVTDIFTTLFERGPKAFFDDMLSALKRTLARMAAEFTTSTIFKLLFGRSAGGGGGFSFAGGGGGGAQSGGSGGLLGSLLGGFGGGSGSGGGLGSFATGGFSGGNPAQSILGGGNSPIGGLLGKLPGIGRFFGGGGQSLVGGVGANIGSLPGAIQGVGSLPLQAPGGAAAASGLGSLASLGAGGLLAGGGFLGSLAGGKSPLGRLVGGVGGTLGAGVLGASGLFGGTFAAALPALFSNPITAVVAAGLIGGALIINKLSNRTEKALGKAIKSEYQVEVKDIKFLKQIKKLGDEAFKGQGGAKKNQLETIRLKEAKDLITQHAIQTGQTNSKLVREAELQRELQDPLSGQNRFAKRQFGGSVRAGVPVIVGDGGRPEVFASRQGGEVFPSIRNFERQLIESLQASSVLGGIFAGAKQQLIGQLSARASQSAPQAERFDGRRMERAIAAVGQGLATLADQVSRLEFASPDDVVQKARPETFADKTSEGLATGGQRVSAFQNRLGLA